MTNATQNQHEASPDRITHLLARVRQRQLELAMMGRVRDSARYAGWASRVRRFGDESALAVPHDHPHRRPGA